MWQPYRAMRKKHPLAVWREAQVPPMSQADFARAVKVGRWTINSLETGRRKPSIALIKAVSAATGGSVGFDALTSVPTNARAKAKAA